MRGDKKNTHSKEEWVKYPFCQTTEEKGARRMENDFTYFNFYFLMFLFALNIKYFQAKIY